MAGYSKLSVVNKQILVSGALRYSKMNWGKPDYYKNPLADYKDIVPDNQEDEVKWFFEDQFINTEEKPVSSLPSFSSAVVDCIDRNRLVDSDVYTLAGIDRSTFSKIVNAPDFKPTKDMCIALCLALNVSAETAQTMLSYAGYSLNHENKRDLYIEFLLTENLADPAKVNEVLAELGEKVLMEE